MKHQLIIVADSFAGQLKAMKGGAADESDFESNTEGEVDDDDSSETNTDTEDEED
jgi:hypothetical protein